MLWLYLGNSQVSVYRTIGPTLVYIIERGYHGHQLYFVSPIKHRRWLLASNNILCFVQKYDKYGHNVKIVSLTAVKIRIQYANTPMQYTTIFHDSKKCQFSDEKS